MKFFSPKQAIDLAFTTHHLLCLALFASHDPKGFKLAAKHPKWMLSMHDELNALKHNDTWALVPKPKNKNVVGSK